MTLTILSLEDEADVRDALERDLEQFWDKIRLEVAEDVDDAWTVIDEIVEDGDELALVLSDHRLPGKSGVDFLVELMKEERFGATRTVLVTGQADQSDTIRAVNQAGLDYYIGKPWNPDELRAVVRDQLTENTARFARGLPANNVLLSGARLPRWMWWGLSAGSLGGIAFVIWFLSVSIMTFGKLCPFCMVIWSVTIPVAAHSWAWAAAGGHLGLRDNLALDVLKARWWIMAAMYLAVVLTIIIAFGGPLARLFG